MQLRRKTLVGGSRFATFYLAVLIGLLAAQPLIDDTILFYTFMGVAVLGCFLPHTLSLPLFLALYVLLLLVMAAHTPLPMEYFYAIGAFGGVVLAALRLTLRKLAQNQGFEGSKAQLDAFWETIVDGLVVIDDQATIVAVNPAVVELFGYSEEELLGQNVKILMPHKYAVEHDGYVSAYNTTGQAKIIGLGREVEGKRKDGSEFPMYLAVSRFNEGGQRFYCGIVRDMTIEKDIRESLLDAKEAAESSSQAKTKFLSSISHEVRTPLNAILGFSQLLETTFKDKLSEDQKDYFGHIQKSGEHLLALITEVLEMSHIESGKLRLSIERIDAVSVLEDSLSMVSPVAEKYEVSIHQEIKLPPSTAVRADRVRLKQALINLGTNAIKYNRRGGRASWRVTLSDNGYVRYEVTDTGFGISAEQSKALYEPFNRLGREASTVEGTGIGLSVTKTLVEAMEGILDYESIEGVGTKFWIELPVAVMSVEGIEEAEQTADQAFEPIQIKGEGGVPATILYIEDNPANMVLMQRFLSKLQGVKMLHAKTAEIGLQTVQEQKVDLILMDLNLPGMNGFEAQLELSRDERTKNIPVVAVSADVNPTTIKRAMNMGFKKFISKPFNLSEAQQTIRSVLPDNDKLIH
jgi:PAS domain S-box-containing protein